MTANAMCEAISYAIWCQTGIGITPEEIWNCSPSGELWPVYALFRQFVLKVPA